MLHLNDTIAAISTPLAPGAIGIVRLSGNKSLLISKKIISFHNKSSIQSHRFYYGFIKESDSILDQIMVVYFQAPKSFTGEDMVEIYCHGSIWLVQHILELIIHNGARLAEAGEFSRRAFLHSKIDLVQAEAIDDLIKAKTLQSHQLSIANLQGKLSSRLLQMQQTIKEQCIYLELELDFSEEDLEFVSRTHFLKNLNLLMQEIDLLLNSFKYGRMLREGAKVVLIGKTNVGKSSLLNRLLQQDRALVSEIPGTTRDFIDAELDINGFLFQIIDNAGIRITDDPIEQQGVIRAEQNLQHADIAVVVFDQSQYLDDNDFYVIEKIKQSTSFPLIIANKSDLALDKVSQQLKEIFVQEVISLSAHTGEGVSLLEQQLQHLVVTQKNENESIIISKFRHYNALYQAKEYLLHAIESTKANLSPEFISADLREALNSVGEILGQVSTDDLLNDIFTTFCIGK